MTPSLQELGLKYGTDKALHGFLPHYDAFFAPLRNDVFDFLEIGVKQGASIRMWHEYFPNARIIGLDNEQITLPDEEFLPRYYFVHGSQDDETVLREIAKTSSLRVVVDDGSHRWKDQIFSFQVLFPFLEAGGVYVCEDVHTSFGPHAEKFRGDATESAAAHFVRIAEALASDRLSEWQAAPDQPRQALMRKVRSVTFLPRSVIITREVRGALKERRNERLAARERGQLLVTGPEQTIDRRNVILTGLPRSGTTLTCNLLNKLPDTVALHEPMQGRHVVGDMPLRNRCRMVQQFFYEQRHSMLTRGVAQSRTIDGGIPENPFGAQLTDEGLRQHLDTKGEIVVDKELTPDFTLVVKHIASFTAMLGELVTRFPVYAMIRNPLAVLASWATLDAPLQEGRAGPAEKLDPALSARLARHDNELDRQINLLSWFFEQFDRFLPDEAIIRYESLIDTNGRILAVIRPEAAELAEPLASRNANQLYTHEVVLRAGARLLESEGAFWRYYAKRDVEELLTAFAKAPAQAT